MSHTIVQGKFGKVRLRLCSCCDVEIDRISPVYGDCESNPKTGSFYFSRWAFLSLCRAEKHIKGKTNSFCADCARMLTERYIGQWSNRRRKKDDEFIYLGFGADKENASDTASEAVGVADA